MKINLDSPSEDVRIEIIPLIDVIFCILTFFILGAVGLTRQQAINIDLPQAATGATQMREMMIVSVDPLGQTYIDQQAITRPELLQRLQTYLKQNPAGLVVLYAARTAVYDDVVQVLDLLRSVGGDRVALATVSEAPTQLPGFNPNAPYTPGGPGLPAPGTYPVDPLNPLNNPNAPLTPGAPVVPNGDAFPDGQGVPVDPRLNPGTLPPGVPAPGTENLQEPTNPVE